MKRLIYLQLWILLSIHTYAQNENTKWYFGGYAALDFMTNPPTVLNNSSMLANEGCSSVADAAGNLLFYTDGATVWNKQHSTMANGTGLFGGTSNAQSVIIVKQPNNPNLYYVFTNGGKLFYSIVDMSLAAGIGSVTTKNAPLDTVNCMEQLCATKHGNGSDYWIVIHEQSYFNNNFKAYLLTAVGVNTTATISSVGTIYASLKIGCMKFSPTGQKLCIAVNAVSIELFDFSINTGVVSNPLILISYPLAGYYGCEFSPDGTKLYTGNNLYNPNSNSRLTQWDLSANSNSAIVSSSVNLISNSLTPGSLQLAPNGKIYLTSDWLSQSISVIHNPNLAGTACSLVVNGQPISAVINPTTNSYARMGLPNMLTSLTNTPCVTQTISNPQSICAGNFYSISTHSYTNAGNYIDTLQNVFACNGIVIVNTQLVVNSIPNLNVSFNSPICINDSIAISASGANTYTWNSNSTGNQFTTPPFTTTGSFIYTIQLQGTGNFGCVSTNTFSINVLVQPCDVGIKLKDSQWYSDNIKIFPNPTEADLTVNFGQQVDISKISIINSHGLTIHEDNNYVQKTGLSVSVFGLDKGIYLILFNTSAGIVTKSFVKN
ncbi:MAG: T9SS type A sorting domain-containing protein [Bacteroidia bacterium]|jgi:hypothetical protein|nr:T9SS type A sorting domain-containing protein [Bacteroidia bacterium]